MRIDVLTLFDDVVTAYASESIIRLAQEKNIVEIKVHNIRDYTHDARRTVDDSPYGGGPGMILKPEPIFEAFDKNNLWGGYKVFMSPQGKTLTHKVALEISDVDHLVILCGHYEGVDQRVCDAMDEEISIGDYVLSNGAVAASVLIDTVVRLLPGALGNDESAFKDSFAEDLLEYPQYTRPEEFKDKKVPSVLLSGNHAEIAKWRKHQSLKKTLKRRPDLIEISKLSAEEKKLLEI